MKYSRMVIPEAFLATDVILNLVSNVSDGLQVWPNVIKKHVEAELPFMATENILMACVKAGENRQVNNIYIYIYMSITFEYLNKSINSEI